MKTRTIKLEIEDKPDHPAITLAKAAGFILIFFYKIIKLCYKACCKMFSAGLVTAQKVQEKRHAKGK